MKTSSKLSEHMENYLKAILVLAEEQGVVRVKDISSVMHVKMSSVTAALGALSKSGYVKHESYGYVQLTPKGHEMARDVHKRHHMLLRFLRDVLDIDPQTAEKDACGMEHSISAHALKKLERFVGFMEIDPKGQIRNCLAQFREYSSSGKRISCERCAPRKE
ncbi:MAG: metal-dependent transcriptional regulator [Candidatus Omnitrophota bacterium]